MTRFLSNPSFKVVYDKVPLSFKGGSMTRFLSNPSFKGVYDKVPLSFKGVYNKVPFEPLLQGGGVFNVQVYLDIKSKV